MSLQLPNTPIGWTKFILVTLFIVIPLRISWIVLSLNIEGYAQDKDFDDLLSNRLPSLVDWMLNNILYLMLAFAFVTGAVFYIFISYMLEQKFPIRKLGVTIQGIGTESYTRHTKTPRIVVNAQVTAWSEPEIYITNWRLKIGDIIGIRDSQLAPRVSVAGLLHDEPNWFTPDTVLSKIPKSFFLRFSFSCAEINIEDGGLEIIAESSDGKTHKFKGKPLLYDHT